MPSELKQLTRLGELNLVGNPALEKPPGCPLEHWSYLNSKEKVAAFLACLP